MQKRIQISRRDAKEIISAVLPQWKGRKVFVVATDSVEMYDTNWSGGTKNTYFGLNRNGEVRSPYMPHPAFNPFEGAKVTLTPDVILVEHSIFCGQDLGVTIYVHPDVLPKLLNAPK